MKRIKNWLKEFWYKHFVKQEVYWIQSTIILPLELDGKKILQIIRTSKDGIVSKKTYQIEHLLDENLEVTEQTLEMEDEWFKKPFKI